MPIDASQFLARGKALRTAKKKTNRLATKQVNDSLNDILRTAQSSAPVLTGELRGSGRVERRGLSGSVVFDSAHAVYVENGTSRMPPEPYLGPAVDANEDQFYTGLEDALVEGLDV